MLWSSMRQGHVLSPARFPPAAVTTVGDMPAGHTTLCPTVWGDSEVHGGHTSPLGSEEVTGEAGPGPGSGEEVATPLGNWGARWGPSLPLLSLGPRPPPPGAGSLSPPCGSCRSSCLRLQCGVPQGG